MNSNEKDSRLEINNIIIPGASSNKISEKINNNKTPSLLDKTNSEGVFHSLYLYAVIPVQKRLLLPPHFFAVSAVEEYQSIQLAACW